MSEIEGAEGDFRSRMSYGDYLRLSELLGAQSPLTDAHDELLFIIQHQTSELWMKLAIREIRAACALIRAEPSLYQEAILLLRRRGLDVGDAAPRAEAAEPHVECEALTNAWAVVYRDPAHHWDLYELAEKLIDFEDYFRRWRFNHVTTVERIIGLKRGTGGTSGVGYLKRMLEIELFPELWRVRTRM